MAAERDSIRRLIFLAQEEDFVSNLYNRTLLDNVETVDVAKLLDGAIRFTRNHSLDEELKRAMITRLTFRRRLLHAVELDLNPDARIPVQNWKQCLELIDELSESHRVGMAVHEAFSIKIQRTLASSVPPRPMVEISFNDANIFLKDMCRDASDVYQILDCQHNSNILVWSGDNHG